MNAIKHGMTARIPVLPGEDPETFRLHVEGIVDSLSPRNAIEVALAEQAGTRCGRSNGPSASRPRAAATIRAAEAKEEAHQREELHALGRWLLANTVRTKREAAEDLLAFLPEDRQAPFRAGRGEPLAILLRIEATADGCLWLLERWDQLRGRLEQEGGWDLEQMIEAAQLRGERPLYMETAEWECLVQERYVAANPALVEEGRRQLVDQLTEGRSADRAGTAAALRRLVDEETARLEELEAARREREAVHRSELADRLAVDTTAEGDRVRRYQLDYDRKLHRRSIAWRSSAGMTGGGGSGRRGRARAGRTGRAGERPDAGCDGPRGDSADPARSGRTARPSCADGNGGPGDGDGTGRTGERPDADGNGYPGDREGNGGSDRAGRRGAGRSGSRLGSGSGDGAPSYNSAAAAADGEPGRQNEPAPRTSGEPSRQNEPSPAAGGDESPPNEPGGSGRIAALSVPALAFALLILLAARLSAAFAGPVAGPIDRPHVTLASQMVPDLSSRSGLFERLTDALPARWPHRSDTSPTRQRGFPGRTLAGASGWYEARATRTLGALARHGSDQIGSDGLGLESPTDSEPVPGGRSDCVGWAKPTGRGLESVGCAHPTNGPGACRDTLSAKARPAAVASSPARDGNRDGAGHLRNQPRGCKLVPAPIQNEPRASSSKSNFMSSMGLLPRQGR